MKNKGNNMRPLEVLTMVNTMNLKEAFRLQNKMQELSREASRILMEDRNITQTKNTHLRKKVMPEAENEVVVETPTTEYADRINELCDFFMWLTEEREALSKAIYEAKLNLTVCNGGFDNIAGINRSRREALHIFRHMAELRAYEKEIPNGGYGYRFTPEGNQVTYKCDLKKVVTINYDRNKVRAYASELGRKADEDSAAMDMELIMSKVDYEPKVDVNDSFTAIFNAFCESHQA